MLTELAILADEAGVDDVAERFHRHGVVVVTGFCDDATASAAAAELDDVVAAHADRPASFAGQGYPDERETAVRNWPIAQVREQVLTCRSVLRDPRLDEWATAICGPEHKRHPASIASMHSRCFHQVERNRSPRPRTQFNGRVLPRDCPDDVTAHPMFSTGPWNFITGRAE